MNNNIIILSLFTLLMATGCGNLSGSLSMIDDGYVVADDNADMEDNCDKIKRNSISCSACNGEGLKYFYKCSHDRIIAMCWECEKLYDVTRETSLQSGNHNTNEDCMKKGRYSKATRQDLENRGLEDAIDVDGLLWKTKG